MGRDDVTQRIIIIIIIRGRRQKQCFRVRDRTTLCKERLEKPPKKGQFTVNKKKKDVCTLQKNI